MEQIKTGQHINEVTIGEVESLIQDAYKNGWESDDGFLLAIEIAY